MMWLPSRINAIWTRLRPSPAADLTAADLLVVRATLAAGGSPAQAIVETRSTALTPVIAALQAGVGLPELAVMSGRVTPPSVANRPSGPAPSGLAPSALALVQALAMAQVVGASAGPAVEGVLRAVTAQTRLSALISIRSTEAVFSARFLIGLPIMAAGALFTLNRAARTFLTSPIGLLVMLVAAVLIGCAALWMHKMTGSVAAAGGQADPLVRVNPTGPNPVMVITAASGVVATLSGGPAVGMAVVVMMLLLGGPLRRRIAGVGSPPVDDVIVAGTPSALPTVVALDLLCIALTSGVGLLEACRLTSRFAPPEVRPVFAAIAGRLGTGVDPTQAFPTRLTEIARLLDISHRWGAPAAESLRCLADDLRDRAAVAAEEAAERLSVRLVFPTTMLLVPAFGLLVVVPVMASILSGVRLGL
ncbi:MAG: type II secretion system F family protein [Euzebya sp.]